MNGLLTFVIVCALADLEYVANQHAKENLTAVARHGAYQRLHVKSVEYMLRVELLLVNILEGLLQDLLELIEVGLRLILHLK